ncbi:MAG TPA: hypothetical protein VGO47_07935 [Chlamydiales bacterium]|nr:hypothetical protein [Chlamydiales bacterium]
MPTKGQLFAQILGGSFLLLIACFCSAYAGAYITIMTLGFGGAIGDLIGFCVPLILATVLFFYGVSGKQRGGLAAAPFVFFGVWFGVSIAFRAWAIFAGASLEPHFSAIDSIGKPDTLVVGDQSFPRSVLANGIVEKLVIAQYTDSSQTKLHSAEQIILSKGGDCTKDDMARSSELHEVGRTEECYKSTKLQNLPDGLYIVRTSPPGKNSGCCAELVASSVKEGKKSEILVWKQGYMRVPAYLPFYRMDTRTFVPNPTGIWESPSGPIHYVAYGAPKLQTELMANVIFGKPVGLPPLANSDSSDNLAQKALLLADTWEIKNIASALSIASILQEKGDCNETCITVLARSIAIDSSYLGNKFNFVRKASTSFNDNQKSTYDKKLLDLLSLPRVCAACNPYSSMSVGNAQPNQVLEIIQTKNNLELWQYGALLRLMNINLVLDTEYKISRRKATIAAINASPEPERGQKILAFIYVSSSVFLDEDIKMIAGMVDELSEDVFLKLLEGSYLSPAILEKLYKKHGPIPSELLKQETWNGFREKLQARVEAIPDLEKRKLALKSFRSRFLRD